MIVTARPFSVKEGTQKYKTADIEKKYCREHQYYFNEAINPASCFPLKLLGNSQLATQLLFSAFHVMATCQTISALIAPCLKYTT